MPVATDALGRPRRQVAASLLVRVRRTTKVPTTSLLASAVLPAVLATAADVPPAKPVPVAAGQATTSALLAPLVAGVSLPSAFAALRAGTLGTTRLKARLSLPID